MISVLIPVYNWKISNLVNELLLQFNNVEYQWEFLIADDASDKVYTDENNEFINSLDNSRIKLFQHNNNVGNAANRNFLVKKASFTWLLFLDADVLPVNSNFIAEYVNIMAVTKANLIVGNLKNSNIIKHKKRLRYSYDAILDKTELAYRKENPHAQATTANFAIRKEIAALKNFPLLRAQYGYVDTFFFLQFESNNFEVIENPVYHLGIDSNEIYLKKTESAVINAYFLLQTQPKLASRIKLVKVYRKIRFINWFLYGIYTVFGFLIKKQLLSVKPSIKLLLIYKLLYISYLDVSENSN